LSASAPIIPPGRSPSIPLGLGLWTAERRSEDGWHIRYIVANSAEELAAKLETAETVEP
jgi:hypothetical protein